MISFKIFTKHNRSTSNTLQILHTFHPIGILVFTGLRRTLILFQDLITDLLTSCKTCQPICRIMKNNRSTWTRALWKWQRTSCNNSDSTNLCTSCTVEHTRKPTSQRMPSNINLISIDTIILLYFLTDSIKKLVVSKPIHFISSLSPVSRRSFLMKSERINKNCIIFTIFQMIITSDRIMITSTTMKTKNQFCRTIRAIISSYLSQKMPYSTTNNYLTWRFRRLSFPTSKRLKP